MSASKEGIVLRSTSYGENRLVVNLYTADKGTLGFIATISRKGKGGLKKAHFQNLQILDIDYTEHSKGELKPLKQARILHPYQSLYFDPIRSCLSLFLAEFLYKVLKEEEPHPDLYVFIKRSLIILDTAEGSIANFHLAFLMELTSYLGFSPQLDAASESRFFDLLEGECRDKAPDHPHFIESAELQIWSKIQSLGMAQWQEIQIANSNWRRQILQSLIDYYRLHLHDFGKLNSLQILREVLA